MMLVLNSGQQSWTTYLIIFAVIAIVGLISGLLGKLFPSKANTAAGNALMHAEVFFNPSREKVIEARKYEEKDDEQSGDPPTPGT